ncbi:hypothetical protein AAG906_032848 [Vitis piasezkii]
MLRCKPIDIPIEPNHKLNISFVMGVVSQLMHNPKDVHFQVAYRVLRYLKSTQGKWILFRKDAKLRLEVRLIVDKRSTSRHCTLIGENLITWRSKKRSWW